MGKLAGPTYWAPMSSAIALRVVFCIFIGKRFWNETQKYKKSAKSIDFALFYALQP
jgi:hypothetical protein